MSIDSLYNTTVSVERLKVVSGNKKDYGTHITSLACSIQPLDPKISQDIEGGFGKDMLMLCSIQDIKEGDRVIHGSDEYRIVGIEKFEQVIGSAIHMEIVLRIFKS